MKKGKILAVVLIGILLTLGLVMVGCEVKDICNGKCRYDRELDMVINDCRAPFDSASCTDKCSAIYAGKHSYMYFSDVKCDCLN